MHRKKILFVCGSIEPGRDGVGDYTTMLANELCRQGHEIGIIALRDKYVKNLEHGYALFSNEKIELIRLPSSSNMKERIASAQMFAQDFNPDWISLQFVPYAYSPHGVPIALSKGIKSFAQTAKIHVMVHESYLTGAQSPKNQIVKIGQIHSIKSMMKSLKPEVIHTSIPSYKELLANIGITSKLLGLFGNLTIESKVTESRSSEVLRAVFFGIGPLDMYFDEFSNQLQRFQSKSEKAVEVIFCGSPGEIGLRFIDHMRKFESSKLKISERGRMESNALSQLFLNADFGIARVPASLLGKSGTAISMLEHGLPLWVPLAASNAEINEKFDFRTDLCFSDLNNTCKRKAPLGRLPQIAKVFEQSLTDHE